MRGGGLDASNYQTQKQSSPGFDADSSPDGDSHTKRKEEPNHDPWYKPFSLGDLSASTTPCHPRDPTVFTGLVSPDY